MNELLTVEQPFIIRSATADNLARGLIEWYKRNISPHKGYPCYHRVLYNSDSCSSHAIKLINEFGAIGALPKILKRFGECGRADLLLRQQRTTEMHWIDPSSVPPIVTHNPFYVYGYALKTNPILLVMGGCGCMSMLIGAYKRK